MRSIPTSSLRRGSLTAALMILTTFLSGSRAFCASSEQEGQSAGPARSLSDPQGKTTMATATSGQLPLKPTIRLEGKAEVAHPLYTNFEEWQSSQIYKQGVAYLQVSNFALAAECFKKAADGFAHSPYDGRFQAEARYAEGQSERLLKQYAKAAKAYALAIDLFKVYQPDSPFLKAAIDQLNILTKTHKLQASVTHTDLKLKALRPRMDRVTKNIPLKGRITELADGTKIAALHDEDLFNGGNMLPKAAAVDVKDAYVKNKVYKAFLDMNCLEFTDLGANYYTAPDAYKAFKSGGKTVVIGGQDDFFAPSLRLIINGQPCSVSMDLPGMGRASKNVLLVTDGQNVLAIDPRTDDTWKLQTTFTKKLPDFTWSKLTHVKKLYVPKGAQAHSLFGAHAK